MALRRFELRQDDAYHATSNAEWEHHFDKALVLKQGDTISFSQAVLTQNGASNQTLVEVPDSVTLTLTVGYYVTMSDPSQCPGMPQTTGLYTQGGDAGNAAFKSMKLLNNGELETTTFQITVEAGLYTPAQLADKINRQSTTVTSIRSEASIVTPMSFNVEPGSGLIFGTGVGGGNISGPTLLPDSVICCCSAGGLNIVWDDQLQRFKIPSHSTPIFQGGADSPDTAVGCIIDGDDGLAASTTFSGAVILYWGVSEETWSGSLWDSMGFSFADLDSSNGISNDFDVKTHGVLPPDLSYSQFWKPEVEDKPFSFQISSFEAFSASSAPNGNSSGYYLLEIDAIASTEALFTTSDGSETSRILTTMNRNYSSEGFVFVFASGEELVVREDTSLTSLRVRILSPKSKEPTTGLGPGSAIFFSVRSST